MGAIVALVVVIVFLGGLKKTPRDQIGISYGGEPIEGQHFQRVVDPRSNIFFNGLRDPKIRPSRCFYRLRGRISAGMVPKVNER